MVKEEVISTCSLRTRSLPYMIIFSWSGLSTLPQRIILPVRQLPDYGLATIALRTCQKRVMNRHEMIMVLEGRQYCTFMSRVRMRNETNHVGRERYTDGEERKIVTHSIRKHPPLRRFFL